MKYVLGKDRLPKWMQNKIMHFKKSDGTVGLELWGKNRTVVADLGDTVEVTKSGDFWVTKNKQEQSKNSKNP